MATLEDLGRPFATGRTGVLHTWPGVPNRVVKLFPPDYPSEEIDVELAACREVDRLGLTPIGCHGRVQVGEQSGIVFDRIEGDSLTRSAEKNPLRVRSGARTLAVTHMRLHETMTDGLVDVKRFAVDALSSRPMAFLSEQQRQTATELIEALPDGNRVLHMDFHTENVFAHAGDHAVIDWQTAMRGDPAADVAATYLLLNDAELWPGTPWLKRVLIGMVRKIVLSTYLAEYQRLTGMTREQIDAWRPVALILRMSILDIPSERDRMGAELAAILDGAR